MSFFSTKRNRERTNAVDRFFTMLRSTPCKKFRLMCILQTNTPTLNSYLKLAYEYQLLTLEDNIISTTEKGKKLLEVWDN